MKCFFVCMVQITKMCPYFLNSALIECHVDAGRKEDATQISIATLAFTKSNVPSLYTTVLGLQVRSEALLHQKFCSFRKFQCICCTILCLRGQLVSIDSFSQMFAIHCTLGFK